MLRRREGRGKGYGLRRRGRNELWFAAAWGGGMDAVLRRRGGEGLLRLRARVCGRRGGLDEGEDKVESLGGG